MKRKLKWLIPAVIIGVLEFDEVYGPFKDATNLLTPAGAWRILLR